MITAELNMGPLVAKLQRLGLATREPMEALVRDQARLFVSSSGGVPGMVQVTPPFSAGVSGNEARKRGEGAIVRDALGGRQASVSGGRYAGIFKVMPDSLLRKATRNSTGTVRLFAAKDGFVYGSEAEFFRPDASVAEMESHHARYFKNGRMTQAGGRTRDIGRWRFIDKMIVGQSAFNRWLRYKKSKVGTLASGFNAAAQALGAKGIPAWVSRHGTRFSGFQVQTTPNSFYIVISDEVPYAKGETRRRMRYILEYRSAAMDRAMPYIIRHAIKKAGFAAVATA